MIGGMSLDQTTLGSLDKNPTEDVLDPMKDLTNGPSGLASCAVLAPSEVGSHTSVFRMIILAGATQ